MINFHFSKNTHKSTENVADFHISKGKHRNLKEM